ncbi:CinA family protein [symbiont of Argiope bruennichi]|uniref:CinA family protein n=1 Tax=symbiont of Argiope bruennichi TaxID=2810479 RepID=UPI003DA66736
MIKDIGFFLFTNFFIKKYVKKIAKNLQENQKQLLLVESATCGYIASEFGKINNASKFFLGSFVVYSKILKKSFLNCFENYLSFDYCKESIKSCKKITSFDFCLSISGNIGKNTWENFSKGSFFLAIFDNSKNKYFFFKKNWNLFFLSRKKCQKILTIYALFYLLVILKNK